MNTATKRTLVAGAALAAAGLLGSLPDHGAVNAQGVPTQHHDVALVDTTGPLVGYEITLDDTLYSGLYNSSTGLYAELYNNAVAALGPTEADAILGTTVAGGADGIFDNALQSFSAGAFLDTWAAEDELNQLLGVTATASETAILADISADPGLGISLADLPAVGSTTFDADLMALAANDFTTAATEFSGYLDSLPTALGDIGGLGSQLGDLGLGSIGDGVSGAGGDLSALLASLLGDLGSFL